MPTCLLLALRITSKYEQGSIKTVVQKKRSIKTERKINDFSIIKNGRNRVNLLSWNTSTKGKHDSITGRAYNPSIDPRKMVLHRWLLEGEWYFLRTRLVQYFKRFWWTVGSEECSGLSHSSACGDRSSIMGNGMHEKLTSISGYVCNILFSIGEDGFRTRRMTSICKLFGRYQDPERKFH